MKVVVAGPASIVVGTAVAHWRVRHIHVTAHVERRFDTPAHLSALYTGMQSLCIIKGRSLCQIVFVRPVRHGGE